MKPYHSLRLTAVAHVLFMVSAFAFGGSPAGPYLVWANLNEEERPAITTYVKNFLKSEGPDIFCESYADQPIIFIKKRPAGIDNTLLGKALLEKNSAAIKSLQSKLLTFRQDPIYQGLDGVIIYSERGGPKMISIGAKSKKIRTSKIGRISDQASATKSFCEVVPPIWRN